MSETTEPGNDPSVAFLKNWVESFSKIAQATCTFTPDSVPPELLRQIRAGIFQTLARSWDEYMRSPQFLEGMKQMFDQAVAARKLTTDFLSRAQQEMPGASHSDIATVAAGLRQSEERIMERLDELSKRLDQVEKHLDTAQSDGHARRPAPPRTAAPKRPASRPGRATPNGKKSK